MRSAKQTSEGSGTGGGGGGFYIAKPNTVEVVTKLALIGGYLAYRVAKAAPLIVAYTIAPVTAGASLTAVPALSLFAASP